MSVFLAREAGCAVLWSEDMQHGALFDGVRVENPFTSER
jgi:predicted nucleic acid-binding protein